MSFHFPGLHSLSNTILTLLGYHFGPIVTWSHTSCKHADQVTLDCPIFLIQASSLYTAKKTLIYSIGDFQLSCSGCVHVCSFRPICQAKKLPTNISRFS